MIRAWQRQLLEDGPSVFASNGARKQRQQEAQEAEPYEQLASARPLRIGRLKIELEGLGRVGTRRLYNEPGSPRENGYFESFNGKSRDELLDREVFYTLLEVRALTECLKRT